MDTSSWNEDSQPTGPGRMSQLGHVQRLTRAVCWSLCAMLVSCSQGEPRPSSDPPSSTLTPITSAVGTEGVFVDVEMIDPEVGWEQLPPDRDGPDRFRVFLDTCTHTAPGAWHLEGRVEVPEGAGGFRAGLAFERRTEDMLMTGALLEVTVSGDGRFGVEHRIEPARREEDSVLLDPGEDWAEGCALRVVWAEVPFADLAPEVSAVHESVELREAVAGSVHALGQGADLGDREDPRRVWAYLAFSMLEVPFDMVWAPSPASEARVRSLRLFGDVPCSLLHSTIPMGRTETLLMQGEGCQPEEVAGTAEDLGEVPSVTDFRWLSREGTALAWHDAGRYQVFVEAEDEEGVVQIAASLLIYSNHPIGER